MPRTLVNGTELFYEVDGDGAPWVVLHGGLGVDHTLYRRTLGPLSPPMQLIYLDHRCNGRSGRLRAATSRGERVSRRQLARVAIGGRTRSPLDRA